MCHEFILVPLLAFLDSGKGGLPIFSGTNSPQPTKTSSQVSLFPLVPAHCHVPDRAAPAPTLGDISCVQTILRGNRHPSLDLPIDRRV